MPKNPHKKKGRRRSARNIPLALQNKYDRDKRNELRKQGLGIIGGKYPGDLSAAMRVMVYEGPPLNRKMRRYNHKIQLTKGEAAAKYEKESPPTE